MASTWSALKVELLETGQNSGQWGNLTNANLGDAVLGEAITGSATVDFASDADVTITLTDFATTQAARNLRLNITESSTGIGSVRNLILGSGCQIEKFYLIRNNGTGVKTIKNTSGTGVAVAAGKATLVYNDGTNVVDVLNSFSSAILGAENAGSIIPFYFANQAAFPSASTYHGAIAHSHADGAMYFAHSGAWVRMLDENTDVTVAQGGTGLSTLTANNVILGNGTSTPLFVAPSTSGNVLTSNGTTWSSTAPASSGTVTSVSGTGTVNGISLSGTVTSSGSLTLGGTLSGVSLTTQVTGTLPIANGGTGTTSTTFANLTTNVTGTLPVANGGTGAATLTANNVLLGNGTSALQVIAPSTSGNVLTSNGTTWASTAPAGGGGFSTLVVYTSTNTFTVPSGVTKVKIIVTGGGGDGNSLYPQYTGGAGGTTIGYLTVVPGNTIVATIGTEGSDSAGGNSTAVYNLVTTFTGTGGARGGLNSLASGGSGSGGQLNITGGSGMGTSAGAPGFFASSFWGGFGAYGSGSACYWAGGQSPAAPLAGVVVIEY